jgi:hypothetical protein
VRGMSVIAAVQAVAASTHIFQDNSTKAVHYKYDWFLYTWSVGMFNKL